MTHLVGSRALGQAPWQARSVDEVVAAHDLLERARVVTVLTGAGISTASGIPDFRGPEGVWTKDPAAELLSSYEVWVADREVRRRAWRRRVETRGRRPRPNDGHRALVALEHSGRLGTLVTQNVDGLHADAGNDPARVVEIHGPPVTRYASAAVAAARSRSSSTASRAGDEVPACLVEVGGERCDGILKSATISFGQSLVAADLARAEAAAGRCDVLLCVGSTLSVWPIAGMVPLARAAGAAVVVVNGGETAMDELATIRIGGAIEATLPVLVDALTPR